MKTKNCNRWTLIGIVFIAWIKWTPHLYWLYIYIYVFARTHYWLLWCSTFVSLLCTVLYLGLLRHRGDYETHVSHWKAIIKSSKIGLKSQNKISRNLWKTLNEENFKKDVYSHRGYSSPPGRDDSVECREPK